MEFSFQYGVLLTLEPSDALPDKNYSVASEGNIPITAHLFYNETNFLRRLLITWPCACAGTVPKKSPKARRSQEGMYDKVRTR